MDEASEEAARAAKRARRESGADGPPVLRPASAAVGKPERRETLVVNDDAPTVEVASAAPAPAAPSPKLKPASQKDEAPVEEPAPGSHDLGALGLCASAEPTARARREGEGSCLFCGQNHLWFHSCCRYAWCCCK